MYANEPAPALSEAWAGNGGGSGSTMGVTDCSLMVYRPPSKREDGTAAGVDAVGPSGGVWAAQHVRYGHLHDSRPVHSPFTSLHRFGADLASGWASCSIGCVYLHLAAGWVPVDLAEVVVVAAAETAAGVGGDGSSSRSDWRALGMGVQAISCSQKKEKKRKKKKKRTSGSVGHVRLCLAAGWVPVDLAEVVVVAEKVAVGVGSDGSSSGSDWRASRMGVQAVSCSQKKRKEKKTNLWLGRAHPLAPRSRLGACGLGRGGGGGGNGGRCGWRRQWQRVRLEGVGRLVGVVVVVVVQWRKQNNGGRHGRQQVRRSQKKRKKRKKKPLSRSGASACTSQRAGCLWTWQRWWQQRRKRRQAWAAAGQTGGRRAWGFKPSVAVKKKTKKKRREKKRGKNRKAGSPDAH